MFLPLSIQVYCSLTYFSDFRKKFLLEPWKQCEDYLLISLSSLFFPWISRSTSKARTLERRISLGYLRLVSDEGQMRDFSCYDREHLIIFWLYIQMYLCNFSRNTFQWVAYITTFRLTIGILFASIKFPQ